MFNNHLPITSYQLQLIMQNKPNLLNTQMNVSYCFNKGLWTNNYEQWTRKTNPIKPKQTRIKSRRRDFLWFSRCRNGDAMPALRSVSEEGSFPHVIAMSFPHVVSGNPLFTPPFLSAEALAKAEVSTIECRESRIEHRASSIQHRVFEIRYSTFIIRYSLFTSQLTGFHLHIPPDCAILLFI